MQPTLNQSLGMKVGNQLGFSSFKVNRDILLVGIESYSDRGSIEKLELDYKTILPPSTAKNLLSISDPSVKRLDSLNNYRIVFSQGIDNASEALAMNSYGFNSGLSFNNGNTPIPTLNNWKRFMHVMSNSATASGYRGLNQLSNAFQSNSNPYLFRDGSFTGSYKFTNISSFSANTELKFDHGFLESPRINNDIVSGDIYEVKSYIKNYNVTNLHRQICNFDINIVSGTNSVIGIPSQGDVSAQDFISGSRGVSVFTTFNNPVKWTSLAHNIAGSQQPPNTYNGIIATSNYFLMPSLPQNFNGINVQIGPANSDHEFSLDLQSSTQYYPIVNSTGPSHPSAYYANKYIQTQTPINQTYAGECVISPYNKPPHNFGIGLPWFMMNEVYTEMSSDLSPDFFNDHYRFWWRDANAPVGTSAGVDFSYQNEPTAADDNVALAAFEVIRYSKNPYMLYRVKKFKYNGLNYSDTLPKNKYLVNQLNLGYSFKVDSLFSYVYSLQNTIITQDTVVGCTTHLLSNGDLIKINKFLRKDFLGFQNVYLLSEVKQIPVNGAMANAPSSYVEANLPTTHFYYSKMDASNLIDKGTRFNFTGNIHLITKIVDQLGGVMTYDYYPLHDVYHTHFLSIVPNNSYGLPKPIDYYNLPEETAFKVQIVVKEKKYFNSQSAVFPTKTWQYEYLEGAPSNYCPIGYSYYGKNKTAHTGIHYFHDSYDADFGFITTIVKYPQLNSSTIVPYDRYTHFNNENQNLTFGKLKRVEKFNAAGQLLNKKEYEYKSTNAYGNFLFTANRVVSNHFNDNHLEYTYDYITTFPNFALNFPSVVRHFASKCNMSFSGRRIPFLEMNNMGLLQTYNSYTYPNSYFVRLIKETNTDYDYAPSGNSSGVFVAHSSHRGINLSDFNNTNQVTESFSGINTLKLESNLLTSANPLLITSNALPLMQATPLTTITEYEYWDADSMGISYSDGFEYLLNETAQMQGSQALKFEPSFELFRTKTYSPHLAGAYSMTENYYYYDAKQDVTSLNQYNTYQSPQYFDALNYSHMYGIRNLMYQKTVISKAVNQPAIAKSEYYWYDTRTLSDTVFYYDTLYIDFDYCNGGGQTGGGTGDTGDTGGSSWTPDPPSPDPLALGCYQVPHPFAPPLPGYTITEVTSGDWWYCPSQTGNSTERNGNAARYLNIPSDMKTKLMLRRIDEQIDTIKVDLTTYYHKYHPVLRFQELFRANYAGGPLNIPMNEYGWVLPYKTKTKYKTLEHTIFGQVRLDMNERGLKTRYNYQTVFSTTFIDNVSNCPTNPGGAYNLSDQGVPKCITIGSGLPDSLTTCYSYNKDYTINSITDPNGMVLSYEYDNFSRMVKANRNGQTLSLNEYSQWMNDTTLSYEQRADQNYVESYILLNSGSTIAEHSRAYIDPLGRKYDVQTQVTSNYTNPNVFDTLMVHSGLTTYDNWDRVSKQYKPFKRVNSGNQVLFSPQFNPTANFTEQQYEGDQRGRVLRAAKFGENINTGHTVNSTYKIITGLQLKLELAIGAINIQQLTGVNSNALLQNQRYLKTSSIDEDSKKTISYTNAFGQKVATKTYANSTGQEVTGFVYDSQGNLKKVINPKFQNTTYEYNLSGNMYRKVSVDADTVKYMYDVSGNVVLEQDANGKHGRDELNDSLYMRRYTYDIFGRMTQQDRVHYKLMYDPLRYSPFIYGYFSGLADTTKAFYQFTNTATLDFYGGWIVEKCITGGLVYRQTVPTGNVGPINPFDPGFDPNPNGPTNPPTNPCSMVYGYFNDSLTLSAPEKSWAFHFPVDASDSHLGATTLSHLPAQNYLKGRLGMAKSYSHDGTFSNLNIYSYNNVGLMEKEITQFNQIGGINIFTSIINYPAYNLRNSLVEQTIDSDADGVIDMSYNYGYDGWNRLRTVSVKQGVNSYKTLASYNYDDALGLITKTKYYDLVTCNLPIDSINYVYDTRNRIKQINSTLYSERLLYDGAVPITQQPAFGVISSRNYNGNINGLFHTYKLNTTTNYASTAGIMDSTTVYGYRYDGLNRLLSADASVLNVLNYNTGASVYNPRKAFGDEVMKYDAIGNIASLNRGLYYNPSTPTPANYTQNWNYAYQTGNNHLLDVDSVSSIHLREYNYDNNGNQNSMLNGTRLIKTHYMRSNLPENDTIIHNINSVGDDNTSLKYAYNFNDDRIYKKYQLFRDIKESYYLRDASGKEIAEYNITNNSWTYYAYGRERIADFDASGTGYYITDHLGSVRLTYSAQGNCHNSPILYTIKSANDYYAFGRSLRSFNNTGKYGHQGSEKEKELSDNDYYTHFRGLDDDIARWKQVDPKMETDMSWSPYVSMLNNPIINTDVNGDWPPGGGPIFVPMTNFILKVMRKFLAFNNKFLAFNNFMKNNKVGKAIDNSVTGSEKDKKPLKTNQYGEQPLGKGGDVNNHTQGIVENSTTSDNPGTLLGGAGAKYQYFRYMPDAFKLAINNISKNANLNGIADAIGGSGIDKAVEKVLEISSDKKPEKDDSTTIHIQDLKDPYKTESFRVKKGEENDAYDHKSKRGPKVN